MLYVFSLFLQYEAFKVWQTPAHPPCLPDVKIFNFCKCVLTILNACYIYVESIAFIIYINIKTD